jgi:vacuolar iron transporter family protein
LKVALSLLPALNAILISVIGLSDGLTVPFALTAGLSSLGQSKLVVLGGVAELIAGAISMGIGGFLASQAERDHYRFLKKHTSARIQRSCAGEVEREVYGVLGPVGVSRQASKEVANCLRELEDDQNNGVASGSDEESARLRWSDEVGLSAFLMKFGEGLGTFPRYVLFIISFLLTSFIEDIPTRRLYISAFTIGMGYLLGGLIPLLPYFFIPVAHVALMWSCVLTGMVLLIFGAIKARVTGAAKSFGSYVWGAVSTLLVGGAAAGAAYGIVAALET